MLLYWHEMALLHRSPCSLRPQECSGFTWLQCTMAALQLCYCCAIVCGAWTCFGNYHHMVCALQALGSPCLGQFGD